MQGMTSRELKRTGREHHSAGRLEAAESFYRQALELDKTAVDARLNLGMVLHNLGRNAEAADLLGKLAVEYPTLAAGWAQLASALVPLGFAWEAHKAVARALELNPDVISLLAASVVLMKLDDTIAAESAARRALQMSPDYVPAWVQLGNIMNQNGRKVEATAAYRRVLALEPANAVAAFFLESLRVEGGEEIAAPPPFAAAPPDYVRALFDESAERFEGSLIGMLKYQAPQILERLLNSHLERGDAGPAKPLTMLDAGCGTGLCGAWMARHRGRLSGVDMSRGMIAKAQARAIYDELIVGEIVEELDKRSGSLDLIVAADVLVYFGDLSGLFKAAASALRPGGVFLFSVEASPRKEYVLLPSRRFAHSLDYLRRLSESKGLAVRAAEDGVVRLEKGVDVRGHFVLVEKIA